MSLCRTPVHQNTKRKLETDFTEAKENDEMPSTSKKLNSSNQQINKSDSESHLTQLNKFNTNILESEIKSSLFKIATLEQQLLSEKNERTKLEMEYKQYKDKQADELRSVQEMKQQLELSLRNSKTNEKLIISEMEHMRSQMDTYDREKLPEKDKEIQNLRTQIENLNQEIECLNSKSEKTSMDSKFDIESYELKISQYQDEIANLNLKVASNQELSKTIEQIKKENCLLNNKIRDLEAENGKLKENGQHFENYVHQNGKIDELDRENRKLKSELDYFKAIQEKSHLYREELDSKKKQLERVEKRLVDTQVENHSLNDQLKNLKDDFEKVKASNPVIDQLKNMINDLNEELSKNKEKVRQNQEEIKKFKSILSEKDAEIGEFNKRVTRLNTERNAYKNILDMYESGSGNSEIDNLKARVQEQERIIDEYKRALNESNNVKIGESVFELNKDKYKSVEIQANLTGEIYSTYESKIEVLSSELQEMRQRYQNLEEKALQDLGICREDLMQTKSEDVQVLEIKLKEQISLSQKQINEFKKKALEITRIIRSLLGFKVNFEDKTVKLTSYKNTDDYILFRVNPDQSLSLMSSDFVKPYTELIEKFIKKHNSIAGFLAAIYFDSIDLNLQIAHK